MACAGSGSNRTVISRYMSLLRAHSGLFTSLGFLFLSLRISIQEELNQLSAGAKIRTLQPPYRIG
ncbi:hypothetical protein AciX8_4513 [Granulicella mallensis MP5ACTX8]|uniref:Uncharacterized protein n=1 Tax=Granulicella mallensis (strain ATCC BAA-1857 / DSM 23137 / MP5ACTX8) TaxID=682795 RepID=G8NV14_GRAMM|nr:hypothetical protein AciX8_4513 [Granulicella mallensis MP5ACTX8]